MNFSKIKSIKFWVLLASGLFLAAVMLASSCNGGFPKINLPGRGGLHFSHNEHVKKQTLECSQCHALSEDGATMGAPAADVCSTCHSEPKDADKLELLKTVTAKWPRFKALAPDGIFSHKKHADSKVECASCHNKVAESKQVTRRYMPIEKDCLKCHREKKASTDCATCHKEINRKWAPQDHKQGYERQHGAAARDPIRGERCFRCHERSYCDTCHQTEKPISHGSNWREFGHGMDSQIDRSRCQTCHQTDYCIRCHQESVPRSHNASWYPPTSRHCLNCHLGQGDTMNCYVCHGANIRHTDAPARPSGPPHSLPVDCRACHKAGLLLQHADNGDNCLYCHK